MPLPSRYLKVIFDIDLESYLASNVLWYEPDAEAVLSQEWVNAAETAARAQFTDPLVSVLSTEVDLFNIWCAARDSTDMFTSEGGILVVPGEQAGTPLPNQDCVGFVKHLPALNGRLSRGHMYLSGIPENHVTANKIDNVLGPDLTVLANAMFGTLLIEGTNAAPSVIHLSTGTHRLLTGVGWTQGIRSIRRRRPRS